MSVKLPFEAGAYSLLLFLAPPVHDKLRQDIERTAVLVPITQRWVSGLNSHN